MPPAATSILDIRPLWAVEGGRVALYGSDFPVDGPRLPDVRVGPLDARVVHASSTRISLVVPQAIEGGTTAVRLADQPGATAFLEVGRPIAAELHQVDSPVFDPAGNLYVTISGRRGQQAPVSIFRLTPDGSREPLPVEIPNPTSMAVDRMGQVYVSSRFEGSVYRIVDDGHAELVSGDLGSPCGLAVGPDGTLYVGDRSGAILRVGADREVAEFASLPSSIAAFHLAFGPDGCLYVSVPTLCSRDSVYRITPDGQVSVVYERFGRPQGLAFDDRGDLYVVDALAGGAGLFRLRAGDRPGAIEQVLAAPELVGVAFDPHGGLVVASSDTVYRIEVPLRPLARPTLGV